MTAQAGMLAWQPTVARALTFDLAPGHDPRAALERFADALPRAVVAFGLPLVLALGKAIPGLRAFPAITGPGCAFPSTQGALWAYLGAATKSEAHDGAAALRARLGEGFAVRDEVRCYRAGGVRAAGRLGAAVDAVGHVGRRGALLRGVRRISPPLRARDAAHCG